MAVLDRVACEFGWQPGELLEALTDPALERRIQAQFDGSRRYGTNALPNVLIASGGQRRLLFGGYADSEMMVSLIRDAVGI